MLECAEQKEDEHVCVRCTLHAKLHSERSVEQVDASKYQRALRIRIPWLLKVSFVKSTRHVVEMIVQTRQGVIFYNISQFILNWHFIFKWHI